MPEVQQVEWARFRAAVVALVALTILGTLLYLLTGGTAFKEKATLYLYVPDATGIGPGSPVEVDGIKVGKVSAVRLSGSAEPNRVVRVSISVERQVLQSIPAESFAQLSVASPVGDKFVDITSHGTGVRLPNSEITYREEPDIFKTLDLTGLERQLRDIDKVLTDIETGQSLLGQFVQGTQMYDDLRRRFTQIDRDVGRAASTTSNVGQVLYSDKMYQRIRAPIQALDQTLGKMQSGQGPLGQMLRDTAQYEQARASLAGLRQNLESLGKGGLLQSDELYNGWTRAVTSLIQSVDQVNADPLFRTSEAYDNLSGFAADTAKSLRDFRQNPKKYLRMKLF
jgi:phospholipid/cholesterol/gamma-HCH transport system substrate-binding protein